MSTEDSSKQCPKCGEIKPRAAFYRCKARKDGLQFRCKDCQVAYKKYSAGYQKTLCSVEGCERVMWAKKLCNAHYTRLRLKGDPGPAGIGRDLHWKPKRTCSIEGCEQPHSGRGWCTKHYKRWQMYGDPLTVIAPVERYAPGTLCEVEGCERPPVSRGWCGLHYDRWQRHGDPEKLLIAPMGSGHIDQWGYKLIRADGRTIREHRQVMEEMIGRPLYPDETVHHKNGIRADNRPENLELWVSRHPRGQRVEDVLAWAYEMIRRYAQGSS